MKYVKGHNTHEHILEIMMWKKGLLAMQWYFSQYTKDRKLLYFIFNVQIALVLTLSFQNKCWRDKIEHIKVVTHKMSFTWITII